MPFFGKTLRLIVGLLLFASTQSFAVDIPQEWDQPRQKIADAWRIRKEVISVGNDPIGAKQLEQIRKIQQQYSLSSLPIVSLSLLQEIQSRGATDKKELLQYTELFSPNLPTTAFFQCTGTDQGKTFFDRIESCIQGLNWTLTRSDGQLRLLSNLFFVSLHTFLWVTLIFFIFFCIRYGISISQALSKTLKYVSPGGVIFLTLLISFLTWLYLGWLGPALLFFFILWRHTGGKERFVLTLLWLLATLLPLAMYAPALLVRYDRGIVSTLERPLEGMFLGKRATHLRRWVSQHPNDAEALFTLGVIEKETGRLESAKKYYQKASSLRPAWHKPIVNLATIAFLQKDVQQALSLLHKSTSIEPNSVITYFNLGKIYLDQTRLDEAQTAFKHSKNLDATLFAELDRTSNANKLSDFLIDESLSTDEIFPRIWKSSQELTRDREILFHNYFSNISLFTYWILLGLVFLASLLVSKKWPARDLSGETSPTDPRPRSSSLDIFDPNLSRAFKREYSPLHAFWEKFQERWCTFILPGAHHLFREHLVRAFFWLFVSVGLLVLLLGRNTWVDDPFLLPGFPTFPTTTLLLSCFMVVYLYEGIRAIRS